MLLAVLKSLASPNFFLNFSTRPALSMNFCLPVKKGWHWEQISTRISFFVDWAAFEKRAGEIPTLCGGA